MMLSVRKLQFNSVLDVVLSGVGYDEEILYPRVRVVDDRLQVNRK